MAPLFDALAATVLEAWPDDGPRGRSAAEAEMEAIGRWVAAGGTAIDADAVGEGDVLLQRRLLEALRLACLGRWEAGDLRGDGRECLDLLVVLERRARSVLPRDARDFASRLADPDGFELLVEVAHDLRSPLTSVAFLAETLRGGFSGPLNDQQRHQLGLVYSAAVAMQSVVTDVMDLARHGGDVLDETPTAFSLAEVFDGVRRMVEPIAEVKGLELKLSPPDSDRFMGRPLALGRVLLNLVTNGLKFTDDGYVEVAARRVGRERIEFSVRDTGRGIDAANRASMFEAFRKSRDRPGSYFSGSGLGLSIVRRVVGALGSELELETAPEWGTRFHFTLDLPSVAHL